MAVAKRVDLLALIARDTDLRRVAATDNGEYAGACPFCGGTDRFRLLPSRAGGGRWYCRKCTPRGGDAIDYVMRRDRLGFREAVKRLTAGDFSFLKGIGPPVRAVPTTLQPPPPSWQVDMRQRVAECTATLWKPAGSVGLDWLHGRGLTDDTIRRARLGYSNGFLSVIPSGVVIPCEAAGDLWAVKVRRLQGEPKYQVLKGSRLGALYLVDWLCSKPILIITEGEFDSLLMWQETHDLCDVVTLGSATAHVAARFLLALDGYAVCGFATDNDEQGERAAEYWQDLLGSRAIRMPPPGGAKDVTDAWAAGSNLRTWVAESMLHPDDRLETRPDVALVAESGLVARGGSPDFARDHA
jgi:DNA primase